MSHLKEEFLTAEEVERQRKLRRKNKILALAIGACALITLFAIAGWTHTLIREKIDLAEILWRESWQRNAVKLFLVSEAAIFGALFAHHYYARAHFPIWAPA